MRIAARIILLTCAACATAPPEPAAQDDANFAKLSEQARGNAVHARNAWEAARETERFALEQYRAGRAAVDEASRATEARLRAERDLAVCDLAADEMEITARFADRRLDAPVVDGEDYVVRWLEIEEIYAERIRNNLTEQHALADKRLKAGQVKLIVVLPLDGEAAIARAEHKRWRELAALRRRMSANAIEGKRAYEQASAIIYSTDVEISRIRVRTANRVLKYIAAQHGAGLTDESKVLAAKSELLRLQNEQHEAEMGRGPGLPTR